jgi:GDPmannose 4,6-dehydratase
MGNLDARRDWGYAGDYVRAMWQMLQQDEPRDYVVGTGVQHSVRDLVELAFAALDLDWRDHVVSDEQFMRPAEVETLVADASLARKELGWKPATDFEGLVRMMVEADLAQLQSGLEA